MQIFDEFLDGKKFANVLQKWWHLAAEGETRQILERGRHPPKILIQSSRHPPLPIGIYSI